MHILLDRKLKSIFSKLYPWFGHNCQLRAWFLKLTQPPVMPHGSSKKQVAWVIPGSSQVSGSLFTPNRILPLSAFVPDPQLHRGWLAFLPVSFCGFVVALGLMDSAFLLRFSLHFLSSSHCLGWGSRRPRRLCTGHSWLEQEWLPD